MALILNERKEYKYKMVLLGYYSVGKSSIASQYVHSTFDPHEESTIGAAYLTKTAFFPSYTVKYEIWDTAGQERYNSLAPMYYRNASIAVIVFDITSKESFDIAKKWHQILLDEQQNMQIVLVGNKTDLEMSRKVSTSDAKEYASKHKILYFEVSAKTAFNIENLFSKIGEIMPKNNQYRNKNETIRIKKKKKYLCC